MNDSLPRVKPQNLKPPRQVLEKVVVPVNGHSSVGSSLSSVRDQSSEYETPATSLAATPAESLVKEDIASRRSGKFNRGSISNALANEVAKGKRKRSTHDELIETDSLLAQAFQENEYDDDDKEEEEKEEEEPISSTLNRGRRHRVQDSEDDDPFSSSMAEASTIPAMSNTKPSKTIRQISVRSRTTLERGSEEGTDDSLAADMPNKKRVKTAQRTSLPSRAACNDAKQSIKDRNLQQILDSEDSELSEDFSDISLFNSDLDSDAFQESGDSDADIDDVLGRSNDATSLATVATTSSNTFTAPAAGARRRRGRGPRGANSTRNRRRFGAMEDRVSHTRLRANCRVGD